MTLRLSPSAARAYLRTQKGHSDPSRVSKSQGTHELRSVLEPTRNKFNALVRCLDGVNFGSGKELRRWLELQYLQQAGEIHDLVAHPVYPLIINGRRVGRFTPDSRYVTRAGVITIEEVKGGKATKTEAYSLRKRVFEALYAPLTITEV